MTAQPWPVADASVLAPVPEHEELRAVLRDLLETHAPHDEVRRAAELPEGWSPEAVVAPQRGDGRRVAGRPGGARRPGVRRGRAGRGPRGGRSGAAPRAAAALVGARRAGRARRARGRGARRGGDRRGRGPARRHDGAGARRRHRPDAVRGTPGPPRSPAASAGCCSAGRPTWSSWASDLAGASRSTSSTSGRPVWPSRTELEVLDLTRRQARLELDGAPAHLIAGRDEADALGTELAILAAGRAGRRARRDDRRDARPDPHLSRSAPPVRPPARVVPGDQAPARRRARRPRARPVGGSLRGGGLRPGPVLGRAGRRRSRPPSAPTRSSGWPTRPSSCTAGSASPGSTRPTTTSAGPWATRPPSAPASADRALVATCWASDERADELNVAERPEVADVRPGEELDWAALERHLRQRAAAPRGRVLGAAVPERLGQPDLPRPVRRRRPRGPATALRRDRGRCPRHAPRVHRAVAAARGVPTRPARAALLRRPGGHRRPLPGLGVPPGRRGLGPGAGAARGRAGARAPHRLRRGRRARRPAPRRPGRRATSATSAAPTATWTGRSAAGRAAGTRSRPRSRGTVDRVAELLARHLPESGRPPWSTTTSRSTTASSPRATPTR